MPRPKQPRRRPERPRLLHTNKRKISRSLTTSCTPAGILGAEAARPATVCSTALGEIYRSICPLLPERIRRAQCAEFEVCSLPKPNSVQPSVGPGFVGLTVVLIPSYGVVSSP